MEEPLVRVSDSGRVRTLALNRPQALNSFTGAMHGELRAALDAAAGDRNVRCVVVTGTGRGFCAGQDLSDPAVAPNRESGGTATDVGSAIERFYKPLALRIRSMPVPVVAAVNGVAAGAGANFALLSGRALAKPPPAAYTISYRSVDDVSRPGPDRRHPLEEPLVRVSDSGSVRTLALNRPQALNSFTGAMHGELRAALDAAGIADANERFFQGGVSSPGMGDKHHRPTGRK